jgi:hypothetical protein
MRYFEFSIDSRLATTPTCVGVLGRSELMRESTQ